MGHNSEYARTVPFFLDIETIGNPAAVSLLGPVKAHGGIKDPVKVAADIAEREAKRISEAALDIDTAQIVAIGATIGHDQDVVVDTAEGMTERDMLCALWDDLAHHQQAYPASAIVGFNVLGYDLPLLVRRSQVLGVPMGGVTLRLAKYRHDGIVDLMQVMTWDGLVPAKGLSTYCRLFGLDVPDDPSTGAEIAALHAAGNWQAIRDHCAADVAKTRALYDRVMGGVV